MLFNQEPRTRNEQEWFSFNYFRTTLGRKKLRSEQEEVEQEGCVWWRNSKLPSPCRCVHPGEYLKQRSKCGALMQLRTKKWTEKVKVAAWILGNFIVAGQYGEQTAPELERNAHHSVREQEVFIKQMLWFLLSREVVLVSSTLKRKLTPGNSWPYLYVHHEET